MAANTGQVGPDDVWLGKLKEEILEPDLPIVDPHHHLWLRNGYSYLMPVSYTHLTLPTTPYV